MAKPLTPRRPPHNHPGDSICLVLTCPRGAWDAARAAAPSPDRAGLIEQYRVREGDRNARMPNHLDGSPRAPAPDRAGLREAVEDILRNPATYHDVGSIHERLRVALHREDGT